MLPDETLETLVFLRKVAGAGDPGDEVALTSASSPGIGSNNPFNSLPGCSPTPGPSSGAPLVPLGASEDSVRRSQCGNATAIPPPTSELEWKWESQFQFRVTALEMSPWSCKCV